MVVVTIRIYLNQIFKDFHIEYAQLVAIGILCTLYIVCCNGSDDLWKSESWTVSANAKSIMKSNKLHAPFRTALSSKLSSKLWKAKPCVVCKASCCIAIGEHWKHDTFIHRVMYMISFACVATCIWVSSNEYWYAVCSGHAAFFLFAYSIWCPAFMCQTKCTLQTIVRPQECHVSLSESCWTTATYFKRRTNLQSRGLYKRENKWSQKSFL